MVGRRIVGVAVLACAAMPAAAQRWALREVRPDYGGAAGLNLQVGMPQGAFAQYVRSVGGVGGFVTVPVAGSGLGFRLEGSILFHGGQDFYDPNSGLTTRTTSYLTGLRFGPQVTAGTGAMRLYGMALVGFSYFSTDLHYDDPCGCGGYGSSTLWDDWTGMWEAGGGMRLALDGRGRVTLDLGARYQHNGVASYLTDGSVTQNSDGSFSVTPIRTSANLVLYHAGVTFAF